MRAAGNNGIVILRNVVGEDATMVLDNRIEDVRNAAGGSGQFGNGVNAFRAGNVIVRGNRIRGCAFSAVRGNTASSIQIVGNSCSDIGEVALYSEFGFEGAVIANNTVVGAQTGVSVANFNEGGRIAVVQGNIFRNLAPRGRSEGDNGIGIYVEADTAVTGNVVESATFAGIMAGWGPLPARRHHHRQRGALGRDRHRHLGRAGGRRRGDRQQHDLRRAARRDPRHGPSRRGDRRPYQGWCGALRATRHRRQPRELTRCGGAARPR